MKRHLFLASCMATSIAWGECPDLGGSYECSDGPAQGPLEFNYSVVDGVSHYEMMGETHMANGKVKIEEWSVPQAAGGLLLTQALCEENAFVLRMGLNFGFLGEQRFIKTETGLVVEHVELDRNGVATEEDLMGDLGNEIEGMDEPEDRDEALRLIKKLIEEKAETNWKNAQQKYPMQRIRTECVRK